MSIELQVKSDDKKFFRSQFCEKKRLDVKRLLRYSP